MKNTQSPAEVITAILFDPIAEARPRTSVIGALWGQKPEPVPATAPRYRSLAEARQELERRGVDTAVTNYLLTGLSDLVFEAVMDLEQTVNGFKRNKHVNWNNDAAYLGVSFKHEAVAPTLDMMPETMRTMRTRFLSNVSDIFEKRARTSLPAEKINRAAQLAYA
ncbi:MAG: hypothetical protein EBQ96_06145 [Proteobacteria bacterium]|nr:hypothetical protein [Pseudomonadota bacterium]